MDQTRFEKAVALRNAGRITEAIQEFRSMQEATSDPNEKAAFMLGEVRCYGELGRVADAERVLAGIPELAPNDVELRFHVSLMAAYVAAQGGKHEKAILQFQELLGQYADLLQTADYRDSYEDIQQRRAFSMVHLRRYEDALPILKEASSSFSTLTGEDQQEIHLYLGTCYAELQEDRLAKEEFLRTIDFALKNSVEAQARYNLGVVAFLDGAFAQARHQLESILETYPGEIPNVSRKDVYFQLSRTYHYLGDKENATHYKKLADAGA
jgi:tetratricopeptide (TPR) repeat protein